MDVVAAHEQGVSPASPAGPLRHASPDSGRGLRRSRLLQRPQGRGGGRLRRSPTRGRRGGGQRSRPRASLGPVVAGRFRSSPTSTGRRPTSRPLVDAGWEVVRVVDVVELGQRDDRSRSAGVLLQHGYVWVTSGPASPGSTSPSGSAPAGRSPGVIMAIQRHRVAPGRLVRFLEHLASEDAPFAGVIRFLSSSRLERAAHGHGGPRRARRVRERGVPRNQQQRVGTE